MKQIKTILLLIITCFAFTNVSSQSKNFNYFGSYNYGFGNLIVPVSSSLGYPEKDEVIKLKSGSINQFEVGAYYKKFGLGLIHNSYATNASTSYENADVNHDAYFENGILSDKLKIRFTGIELLYKLPLFKSDFDVTWKLGLGFQAYSINKDVVIQGQYSSHNNYTLKGNILTTMAGVELNYQIWKTIGIGFETSVIPGNYKKITNAESPSFIYKDNVSRLSTGLKLKITI